MEKFEKLFLPFVRWGSFKNNLQQESLTLHIRIEQLVEQRKKRMKLYDSITILMYPAAFGNSFECSLPSPNMDFLPMTFVTGNSLGGEIALGVGGLIHLFLAF